MSNNSIKRRNVISQCLSLLPTDDLACPLLNYEYDKLNVDSLFKIFVAAQVAGCKSYKTMEKMIRADKTYRNSLNLPSISGSQLSRRIIDLPTEWAQTFFLQVALMLEKLTQEEKGITSRIGRLKIIDSTHLKLPPTLCNWAYVTEGWNVVKMHTRLVVVSEEMSFPDKILPSTGNVGDVETTDVLVESSDATYVMDRGYPSRNNLTTWLDKEIHFVIRVSKQYKFEWVEDFDVTNPSILKDGKVLVHPSEKPARLLEFHDEKGKVYRLLTTRFDLTGEEIMDIYRHRWIIEIFFKTVKQNLRFVKIWSTEPQGIWNQMFIGLAAYCLLRIIQIQSKTKVSLKDVIESVRLYQFKPWRALMQELNPKKKKTSKGRQKIPKSKDKQIDLIETVARTKEQNKQNKQKKQKN